MPGGYRELEGVTADLGIEAWGDDEAEAFAWAVKGLADLVSDTSLLEMSEERSITVGAGSAESLLINLLNEIIFLEETEGFLPGRVLTIDRRPDSLTATVAGDTFDPARHRRLTSVKAATYHGLHIDTRQRLVRLRVIFDC